MRVSLGHESSATGVAGLYADFLDLLVIDQQDAAFASEVESVGVRAAVTDTIMRDAPSRHALAQATLDAVLR
jgi:LPPG:FO 2-phospho-L-lactate transferase